MSSADVKSNGSGVDPKPPSSAEKPLPAMATTQNANAIASTVPSSGSGGSDEPSSVKKEVKSESTTEIKSGNSDSGPTTNANAAPTVPSTSATTSSSSSAAIDPAVAENNSKDAKPAGLPPAAETADVKVERAPPRIEPHVEPVNGMVHPPVNPPANRPGRITNQLLFIKNNVIKGKFNLLELFNNFMNPYDLA